MIFRFPPLPSETAASPSAQELPLQLPLMHGPSTWKAFLGLSVHLNDIGLLPPALSLSGLQSLMQTWRRTVLGRSAELSLRHFGTTRMSSRRNPLTPSRSIESGTTLSSSSRIQRPHPASCTPCCLSNNENSTSSLTRMSHQVISVHPSHL